NRRPAPRPPVPARRPARGRLADAAPAVVRAARRARRRAGRRALGGPRRRLRGPALRPRRRGGVRRPRPHRDAHEPRRRLLTRPVARRSQPPRGGSERVAEPAPVRVAPLEERVAPLDGLVRHVRQARRLAREDLLAHEPVVREVERELEHPDRLRRLRRDHSRVLDRERLQVRVVRDLVHRAPLVGVLRRVLPREEEDLPRALLPHLPREVRRPVAAVERPDVRVGLLEPRVLAARDRQVRDAVQRVPAPGRPPVDDRDDDLGHRPDEPLHLEDVQAPHAPRVDGIARVHVAPTVGRGRVLVPGAAADALVAARAERPAAVLGRGPVSREEHGPDVGRHARVVEHAVELVDGVGPERVANLRAVERDAHDRQVAHDGAVRVALDAAVVGDVGEPLEPVDVAPRAGVERLGDLAGEGGGVVGAAHARHGSRCAAGRRARDVVRPRTRPAATTSVPTRGRRPGSSNPSTTDAASAATGSRPARRPARAGPIAASPEYHRRNATAVTTTARKPSAASSPASGTARKGRPARCCAARPSAASWGTASTHAYAETRSAPSVGRSGTARSEKHTSHASAPSASTTPTASPEPPPSTTTTPAVTTTAAASVRAATRRARSAADAASTTGEAPTTAPTSDGSVRAALSTTRTLKPTRPVAARAASRSSARGDGTTQGARRTARTASSTSAATA